MSQAFSAEQVAWGRRLLACVATIAVILLLTPAGRADDPPKVELIAGAWLDSEVAEDAQAEFPMQRPFGAAVDQQGTLHVVELEGGRVHRLPFGGGWSTVGGDGSRSYQGDDGPLAAATFNGMHNVAATRDGDLYIADSWNHCVRKVDAATGVITTVAGTGQPGFSGDGGPAIEARFNYVMCVSHEPASHQAVHHRLEEPSHPDAGPGERHCDHRGG